MEKVWLQSYPQGVPEEVSVDEFHSLSHLADVSCEKFGESPAYSNFGCSMSFSELATCVRDFAAYCQAVLQLQKGDRLAIMMPNIMQYPIALFGAFKAGLVVVNVNPLYTPRELLHQLNDSGATAIVILENVAHVLAKILPDTPIKHIITAKVGDRLSFPKSVLINFVLKYIKKAVPPFHFPTSVPFNQVLQQGKGLPLQAVTLTQEDIAFLQYTGGTTGVAKGAVLTHRNLLANIEQAYWWINNLIREGQETIITALPLYHIFSLTANCIMFLRGGAHNVLITNPRDIPAFIKELAKYKFTVITGVNTLFNALLNNKAFDKLDFSHLRVTLGGGMAVQKVVAERWYEKTGCVLAEAYGLTETSPAAVMNPINISTFSGSIGLPIPSTEVKILDEQGEELGIDEIGELCLKGPQVTQGYWQRPEESKQVLDAEGWLKTGDIAKVDSKGFVYIVDRKKDMILVSGFNVFPNELEEVIAAHEDVIEVAAIGIADDCTGEAVKIFVVSESKKLMKSQLLQYCRENLTAYKVPKYIEFCDDLPKSNVGKILRKDLREREQEKGH